MRVFLVQTEPCMWTDFSL